MENSLNLSCVIRGWILNEPNAEECFISERHPVVSFQLKIKYDKSSYRHQTNDCLSKHSVKGLKRFLNKNTTRPLDVQIETPA